MTATRVLLALSVVLQVYILIVWATLYRVLRFSIWLLAATGLCLITVYRVVEMIGAQPIQNILAFLTSLFFAWAAHETRKQLKAQKNIAERLRREAHRPHPVLPEPSMVAVELAKVLNNFHDEIDYYERKADEHQFEKFKTANAK